MEDGQSENWTAYDWFHNNLPISFYPAARTELIIPSFTISGKHWQMKKENKEALGKKQLRRAKEKGQKEKG